MVDINKAFLSKEHTTQKNFTYKKGGVSLAFTLRTDIRQELKDFKDLLEAASEEVKKDLDELI